MDSRINAHAPTCLVRPKKSHLVDRISSLPDSILGEILSFLPTEEAVATTILSKRWKLVWTNIEDLCFFHCQERVDEGKDMKFIHFVNNVLHLHGSGFLEMFSLIWHLPCPIYSQATLWITTAITTRKVHELLLNLDDGIGRFDVPTSVFCCDSLRSLILDGPISVSDSISVSLPKLESLLLYSVTFESEQVFERIIRNCPMLDSLYIQDDHPFTYKISSASLKLLRASLKRDHDLILEAPSLVEADYSVFLSGDELSQADYCNSIIKVVRGFDYANALCFRADVMGALSCGTMSLSTEFKRLVNLEVEAYCCACSSIQDFIQCSHNLEVLTLQKDRYKPIPDLSKWTTPVEVPRCLSKSLKKVIIKGYEGLKEEREMIRYILEHGNVLEVMHISCDKKMDGDEKSVLIQEILEFPRKSAGCKVEELSNMSDGNDDDDMSDGDDENDMSDGDDDDDDNDMSDDDDDDNGMSDDDD